jgi:general secretion pathway protein L
MNANPRSSTLTSASLKRQAGQFFAWWQRELLALLPPQLAHWWRGFDRSVLVTLSPSGPIFERLLGKERQPITITAAATDTSSQLTKAVGGRFRLVLRLDAAKVLVCRIELPLAVEENLAQTLRFELDRFTPFRPDQAYFNFRIAGRDTTRQKLAVLLVVAARATVDQEIERCRALGLAVDGVVPAAGLADADNLDLLPSSARGASQPVLDLRWRLLLSGLALLLLAAVLVLPVWQKRQAAISLMAPLAEAKQAAQATDQLREQLDKLVADYNFLPAKKWEAHSTVRLLDEISRRLPDDTFAIQFDFDGKIMQIQGESGSASTLVELLESSPLLKDVGFKAQLTKLQGTGSDRFHIAASLEQPPAEPAAESAGAPPVAAVDATPAAPPPAAAPAAPEPVAVPVSPVEPKAAPAAKPMATSPGGPEDRKNRWPAMQPKPVPAGAKP